MLAHIPPYVFVLFAVLVAIGISRCFGRRMRIHRLIVTIILLLAVASFGYFTSFRTPTLVDLATAIAGAALGLYLGWHHVRRWTLVIDRAAGTILVPGDPMILIIFMSVFAFKFAIGYGNAVQADWVTSPLTTPIVTFVWCLFLGMTFGRNGSMIARYYGASAAV